MANSSSGLGKNDYIFAGLVGFTSFIVFLLFLAQGIVGGDSGDLVTAAATFGVAHPPGYPLYTFFGWIASRLPLFTPAWRVGLVSLVPHAIVIAIVFLFVSSITKRKVVGAFSSLLLMGNYLFFLYSVTPEVFALLDLFIIVLTYLLYSWRQTKRERTLLIIAFVFGLSLTHHQLILFFVPAVIYWLWGKRLRISMLYWFLAGLIPYAYVWIAARAHSIINWDRPVDISGLMHLITRADYGTFVSGGGYGSLVTQRLLQIQAYAQFILLDFSWIGIVLLLVGFYSLWKRDRKLCVFFFLALLFLGPLFFFYASFPLYNRFTLGTYERFLLPSYVLITVLCGIGLSEFADCIRFMLKQRRRIHLVPLVFGVGFFVIMLYPVSRLGVTLWRFYGLPADRTADNLGVDVLSPLPKGSIILLDRDTTLFSTQYVRYVLSYRPDLVVIHASRLQSPDYLITLHEIFPDISLSATGDATLDLITTQHTKRRIFSTSPMNVGAGWDWVPYGLAYELVDEKHKPQAREVYEENLQMWKTFHDPTSGILSRYNHLMLSDVCDVYAGARIALGTMIARAGMTDEADGQFRAAINIAGDGELANAYKEDGVILLVRKKCSEALSAFDSATKASLVPDTTITYYEALTYRDCIGDTKNAQELMNIYTRSVKNEQTPLNKL